MIVEHVRSRTRGRRPHRGAAVIALAMLLLTSPEAGAQMRFGFTGLRAAPGAASDWMLGELERGVQRHLDGARTIETMSRADMERALGATAGLAACADDGCMVALSRATGVQRVLWGYVDRPGPRALRLQLRLLDTATGGLVASASPSCNQCDEPELLAVLMSTNVIGLLHGRSSVAMPNPTYPPAQGQPVSGYGQPAQPAYGRPAPPAYGQPAPPAYGQPTPPAYAQASPPAYGQPSPPAYGQPAPPAYGQPPRRPAQPPAASAWGPAQPAAQPPATPPAAPPPTATTPGSILQIPGVHRPLRPDEQSRAGWLTLATTPPGAELWLYSYRIGKTPIQRQQLLAGTYKGFLRMEGHADVPLTLLVYPGRETRHLIPMAASATPLRVISQPSGATVSIDDAAVGVTPLAAVVLPYGPHRVTVSKEGFRSEVRVAHGVPGRSTDLSVRLVKASPTDGTLTVHTRPAGASILIEGDPLGQSPIREHGLPAGSYQLEAYLPGYQEVEREVQVRGGEETAIELVLITELSDDAIVSVSSDPPGADAFLGSMRIGKTPVKRIHFKPGRHVLRVVKDGFPPYELPVYLMPQEPFSHHADLRDGPPTRDGLLLDIGSR